MGLVVIVGTGTDVGKTWVTERLVGSLVSRGSVAVGFKPIQSGGGDDSDSARLAKVSSPGFDLAPLYSFADPIAPHIAARRQGLPIDLDAIVSRTRSLREHAQHAILETAGGLFSPITDNANNADLTLRLTETPGVKVLLVARDRIGALHDVAATVHAGSKLGIRFDALVVSRHDGALDYTVAELSRQWSDVIPYVTATDTPEWAANTTQHLATAPSPPK